MAALDNPIVNVVIRTFNEEDWIKHCLLHVLRQNYDNLVITVVDSGSEDATVNVVKNISDEFPDKILLKTVDVFKPGNAINVGASAVDSDYFICLSAHCIPQASDWVAKYVEFMQSHSNVAGCYGKQLPLSCTHADDARDLLITFGSEIRIQEKEFFFHNANSVIRTVCWVDMPFDNDISHVEDRAWAKRVLSAGWRTAYLPDAAVYHYHGLHQHGSIRSFRASNVLNVMNSMADEPFDKDLMGIIGDDLDIPIVILVPSDFDKTMHIASKAKRLLESLPEKSNIFIVDNTDGEALAANYIKRSNVDTLEGLSLRELMRNILIEVEARRSRVVDALVFFDLRYAHIEAEMGDQCIKLLIDRWLPAVMPAWQDYGNYWIHKDGRFKNLSGSYDLRGKKPAIYKTTLGQGAAIRASIIRSNLPEIPVGEVIWTENEKLLLKEEPC